jgi:putative ABC transport system substrate-binding protein
MRRRDFIKAAGGTMVLWPSRTRAQRPERMRRIGFLRVGPPPAAFINGFRRGLREQGLVEGQHFVIEYSLAQSAALIPDAAAELVRRKVDIIVASGTPSALPAKNAAGQIPVVFVATVDPVEAGLVDSLARPGHNVTGMTSISGDLIAKRLQLIKELLPKLTRVAILVRESSPTAAQYVRESRTAALNLGIELQILAERDPKDIDGMFVAMQGAGALVVADDAEFTAQRTDIAELALRNQLPTVSGLREMVEAGGLMAYGASFGELYRRAANQVSKILEGVSPANLPVEQPIKFELVVNLKSAKALGLHVPAALLGQANEVIE